MPMLRRSTPGARRSPSVSSLVVAALVLAVSIPETARPLAAQAPPADSAKVPAAGLETLRAELGRIAGEEDGTVGVAAIHLESGRELHLNGDERFPMASTYKVPIAVQLLTRVERGELALDSMVEVGPEDLHPGSGTISRLLDDPGVILSMRNLLELMLLISDNSGTDLVLEAAGGPAAVTSRMRELGIEGLRVDRPTVQLIADWVGIERPPDDASLPPDRFGELYAGLSEEDRRRAAEAFDRDPRDTATPRAMASLLRAVHRGEALRPESAGLLLDIMRRSETGRGRIRGLLPPEVPVAHKTGTIGGTTNDVGSIELPFDRGTVVLVVFVKASEREIEERERTIAQIGRAVYDYFLFTSGPGGTPAAP